MSNYTMSYFRFTEEIELPRRNSTLKPGLEDYAYTISRIYIGGVHPSPIVIYSVGVSYSMHYLFSTKYDTDTLHPVQIY